MSDHGADRRLVLTTAVRTVQLGLTHGTSGNVSARVADGMAITPTGIPYDRLDPADVVVMALDGTVAPNQRRPSSEWPMHAAIYLARPEVSAVVHCHAPGSTAVSCLLKEIPAFHYMVAVAGGDSIRCAPYAPFGSVEIGRAAVAALDGRTACLLGHHGLIAIGSSLERAVGVAVEVEFLASIYLRLLAIGPVPTLSPEQMRDVVDRFGSYGQR